jgi:hypothetical protein
MTGVIIRRAHEMLGRHWRYIASLVPILAYWLYVVGVNPGPFYREYDPEINYFIDSLSVFRGVGYNYVDHPGTPVSMIGSALLGLTYPFLGGGDFVRYHLFHPAIFMVLAHTFLLAAACACALVFCREAAAAFDGAERWLAVPLVLMFFALHPFSFLTLAYWSHNSFNYPFGTFLLVLLLAILKRNDIPGRRALAGWGGLAGILAASQLYFIAWLICAVLIVIIYHRRKGLSLRKGLEAGIWVWAGGMLGMVVMVLPVFPKLGRFFAWLNEVLFHLGRYGAGGEGFLSLRTARNNLGALIRTFPLEFVAIFILLSIWVLIHRGRLDWLRSHPGVWAMAVGLWLQVTLLLVMIIKQPSYHYMLSIAATLPVLALAEFEIIGEATWQAGWLRRSLGALILLGVAVNLGQSIVVHRQKVEVLVAADRIVENSLDEFASRLHRDRANLVVLYMYGAYTPCAALLFGHGYEESPFYVEISEICPGSYYLALDNKVVGRQTHPLNEMAWDVIVTTRNHGPLERLGEYYAMELPESVAQSDFAPIIIRNIGNNTGR